MGPAVAAGYIFYADKSLIFEARLAIQTHPRKYQTCSSEPALKRFRIPLRGILQQRCEIAGHSGDCYPSPISAKLKFQIPKSDIRHPKQRGQSLSGVGKVPSPKIRNAKLEITETDWDRHRPRRSQFLVGISVFGIWVLVFGSTILWSHDGLCLVSSLRR